MYGHVTAPRTVRGGGGAGWRHPRCETFKVHYGPTPSSAYAIHLGMWCVVCGVWCVVCGVWYVVCGLWYTYHIPHTTYHIPHTTYHVPRATCHIPHTKVYSIGRTWSWPVMYFNYFASKLPPPHPLPPSPSTVRSRDHTVLYCTIVLYSTKNEKICLQANKQRTSVSTTESTLILSGSSPDTRGSWPIEILFPAEKLYFTTQFH